MGRASADLRKKAISLLAKELRSNAHGNLVDVALADSLGHFGSDAFSTSGALESALVKSRFDDVKTSAFVALARVAKPDPDALLSKLIANVRSGSLSEKAQAFGRLRTMGRKGYRAVEALLASCDSARPVYEQIAALDTLSAVSPSSRGAIVAFVNAVRSKHYLLNPAGAVALQTLNRVHLERALEPLLFELSRSDGAAKYHILRTLRRIGPKEQAVVDAILADLSAVTAEAPEKVIYELLEAVRAGAPATANATPRLLELIDPSCAVYVGRSVVSVEHLVSHSLVALSDLGMSKDCAAPVLKEFERAASNVLPCAIRAVGALGPAGAPGVPKLVALLEGKPPRAPVLPFLHGAFPTVEAIRALGRIGPSAKAGIKILEGFANDKQNERSELGALETRAARKALSQIQG